MKTLQQKSSIFAVPELLLGMASLRLSLKVTQAANENGGNRINSVRLITYTLPNGVFCGSNNERVSEYLLEFIFEHKNKLRNFEFEELADLVLEEVRKIKVEVSIAY